MNLIRNVISNFLSDIFCRRGLLWGMFFLITNIARGQAPPNISYSPSSQVYTVNTAITTLQPNNTGGAIPANKYGEVTTFAGSSFVGHDNGTGTAASFSYPQTLASDAAGNLYSTDFNNKLIRKITPAGEVTTFAGLLNDGSGTNGSLTSATFNSPTSIVFDSHGNMFVADYQLNIIRKIDVVTNTVSTFAGHIGAGSFINATGTAAGFDWPYGLAIDAADNIYVAELHNNAIRKIDPNGVVSTVAGDRPVGHDDGLAENARFSGPTNVAVDNATGDLYVADGNNSIRKITAAGMVSTIAGNYGPSANLDLGLPGGMRVDKQGNLYITIINSTKNQIKKLTPAGLLTVIAGSTTGAFGKDDGVGTAATFNRPQDVNFDTDGNLYVADQTNNLIRKLSLTGYTIDKTLPPGLTFDGTTGKISGTPTAASSSTVYTITGYNASGSSTTTVNITVNATNTPQALAPPDISYNTPNTYIANTAITPLQPINNGGIVPPNVYHQVTVFSGSGIQGSTNGAPGTARFNAPTQLSFDNAGNLYVADNGNKTIRKITATGDVTTLAGVAGAPAGNLDGPIATATFANPTGVVVDSHGNVFVADNTNHNIRKIDQVTGMVSTFAGGITVSGTTDGNGTAARFNKPYGLAIDAADNIYVADQGNNTIRKITPAGDVTTLAGVAGSFGSANGPAASATFRGPSYVAVSLTGNVYVGDSGNSLLRLISPAGDVSTVAGVSMGGSGAPNGIRVDAAGNIYFASNTRNQIYEVTNLGGNLISLAGNSSSGRLDGIGSAAFFNRPSDVIFDNSGNNLYITDQNNNWIRKLSLTGYSIDKALPPGLTFDGTTGTISGTPTVPFERTNYIITAYNTSGSSAANVIIQVDGPSKPAKILPPQISYESPQTLSLGSNFVSLAPTNTGGAVPAAIYGTKTNIDPGLGRPTAVAADPYGNVYVTMTGGNKIVKIDAGTATVSVIANPGGGSGQTNGPATSAKFSGPIGITLDSFGNIYVADQGNNSIRKITPAGDVSTFAGSILGTAGAGDGYRNAATFRAPRGITTDASDNIYIADFDNNLIRKIDAQSGQVSTLYDASPPGNLLKTPSGVGVDASGVLYIADAGNNRIQRVTNGPATTIPIPPGTLKSPRDVKVDGTGNIYVTDQGNNRVVRISPDNVVTTVATFAPTQTVVGAVLDGLGNLYIGDNEYKVVKIAVSGYEIDKPLPAGLTFDQKTGIIGGTPTVPTPMQTYTITAYNGGGSNSFKLNLEVANTATTTITFNNPALITNADNTVTPSVATNNTEAPVTYTSNNPAVISVDANGVLHRVGPGTVTITASQVATAHYTAGTKTYTETFKSTQQIIFPAIAAKTLCSTDFSSGATSATSATYPITYTSSNTAVATIDNNGIIHIVHAGNTTITASQAGDANFYDAAVPVSRALVVTSNIIPIVSVTASNGVIKNDLNICVGSPVTFTAAVSNLASLTNPTYQWQVNGSNVGTNSNTYTSPSITATDIVKCTVTTNDGACSTFGFGTSPPLTLIPMSALSVTIQSSVTGAICPGTPVTFTATPSIGGANVIYQWKLNGNNMGTNSTTYASNSFVNGDVVSCTFTNNSTPCIISNTANSNTLTVSFTAPANPAPTVTITASVNNVYESTPITFTATPLNTTGTITYQWQVNGNDAGTNGPTFTSSNFKNGDKVTCTILSGGCAAPATSAPVTITIKPPLQILPPTAFTPNGDGVNDLWTITGLLSYPNCLVKIYSRNGELVYQSKGYTKPWDGAINGKNLPVGTYYYVIDLNSNNKLKVSGYIAIIR